MSKLQDTRKEFEDTRESFRPKKSFEYHSKQQAIDFHFIEDGQIQMIRNLFQRGDQITQEKIIEIFQLSLQQNNKFIQQILQQLTDECKKNRLQKDYFQNLLRKREIQQRKQSEEIIHLNNLLNSKSKENELKNRQINQILFHKQQIQAELNGLKSLLHEYDCEFGNKQIEKEKMLIDLQRKVLECELYREEIKQKAKQNQKIKLKQKELQKSVQIKQTVERQGKVEMQKIILQNKELERVSKQYDAQKPIFLQIKKQFDEQSTFVSHLQLKLLNLNGQIARLDQQVIELRLLKKQNSSQFTQLDQQWKKKFDQLQERTKMSLQKLKTKYQIKIKKLLSLLQKQIKSVRVFADKSKTYIEGQMLVCWKLMQNNCKTLKN